MLWLEQLVSAPPSEQRTAGAAAGYADADLIRQIIQHGPNGHFRLLVQRHQQLICHAIAAVLGPRHRDHVEELAQETFVKIYRNLHRFRLDASFRTWAYRIAHNTAIDRLRTLRNRPPDSDFDDVAFAIVSPDATPEQRSANADEQQALLSAIEQLPDLYRTLVHLHYWQERTVNEIADLLDSRPGTIKSYLHRARAQLKRVMESNA